MGAYCITIVDANGCIATSCATITEPSAITATIGSQTNVSCFNGNNGMATVTGSRGTATLPYLWDSGQSTATSIQLNAGIHCVTVIDGNGCMVVWMPLVLLS